MADVTPNDRIGGYAPGNYTCKCLFCGKEFVGDKRALSCFDCAKAHRDRVDGERLAIEQAAVAAARAQIVETIAAYLEHEADMIRKLSDGSTVQDALNEAAATAWTNAAAAIRSGEPLRWAAEREGERG